MNNLLAAYRHTFNNWVEIESSEICGCCNCMQSFPSSAIVAWVGLDMDNMNDPEAVNKQTALCPKCGSESVIGDKSGFAINPQFLGRMNEAWFHGTIIHRPAPKT